MESREEMEWWPKPSSARLNRSLRGVSRRRVLRHQSATKRLYVMIAPMILLAVVAPKPNGIRGSKERDLPEISTELCATPRISTRSCIHCGAIL